MLLLEAWIMVIMVMMILLISVVTTMVCSIIMAILMIAKATLSILHSILSRRDARFGLKKLLLIL